MRAKVNKDLFSTVIYRKKQQPLKPPLDTCCLPRCLCSLTCRCHGSQMLTISWPYCLFCCFAPLWYVTQTIFGGLCGSAGVRGSVKAARVQRFGTWQMGPDLTPNVGRQTGSHRGEVMVGALHSLGKTKRWSQGESRAADCDVKLLLCYLLTGCRNRMNPFSI